MKKLFTPFALFALTVAAAPPVNPTLTVTCDGGIAPDFGCAQIHYAASPLDPTLSYQIDATGPSGGFTIPIPAGAPSFDMPTDGALDNGDWSFELHEINPHNGNEKNKSLSTVSATF